MILAKAALSSLLGNESLSRMRLRAFTLMPDHLHFLAGVRHPELYLPNLIGRFKSYTTQQYWKRSREVVDSGKVCLPSGLLSKTDSEKARTLLTPIMEWRATLRPEVVELRNWPRLKPGQFLKKRLWQTRLFDHVIRNDTDLHENLEYIAMNSVEAGYVTRPQFYPYTGSLAAPFVAVPSTIKEISNEANGVATECHPYNSFNRSIALRKDRLVRSMSAHKSPTSETRSGIVRSVKLRGPTSRRSTSSQAHGAETGAPVFARTV